jgi:hypothetical protein
MTKHFMLLSTALHTYIVRRHRTLHPGKDSNPGSSVRTSDEMTAMESDAAKWSLKLLKE